MKNVIFFLLLLPCHLLTAQNVGIGTPTPHASAQLDITSTTKGLLIPRMTGAQRNAIVSPAVGLLVIQTNNEIVPPSSAGLYLCEQVGAFPVWRRIARTDEITGGSPTWTVSGSNQYSNMAGNVGIGTGAPTSKFHLAGDLLQESGTMTINNSSATLQMQNAGVNKGFMQLSGDNLQIGTSTGNALGRFIIRLNDAEHLTITAEGNVGIGTSSPNSSAALHINSNTKGLLIPRMTTTERNAISSPAEGLLIYNWSTEQLNQRQSGNWKILINNDSWTGGGSGQMFNIGDNVGINTAGPSERLDVSGNIRSNSSMIIDNASAMLQLRSSTVNKGFLQLSGDNVRFGTNSGNASGDVILRMDGTDMIEFGKTGSAGLFMQMNLNGVSTGVLQTTSTGNVSLTAVNANTQVQLGGEIFINNTTSRTGIGTSSPAERLHVNGNMIVNGNAVIDDGRITATPTGSAYNLLPLAYGRVDGDGNKAGGTVNFTSVTRVEEGIYDVFVTGITTSSVVVASGHHCLAAIQISSVSAGQFRIRLWSTILDENIDCDFHFIVYNP
ncbi:MAG TPA: hypothetical protein PKC54_05740 [Ferruginibacter sp.]|nr:hypothetical protein [Ferruginibacter sp.]